MRLFGSLSFRLALVYAGLFIASIAVLGGLYYWIGIRGPLESVRADLRAEGAQLVQIHRREGPRALAAILEDRAGAPSPRLAYHALLRADGSVVTTNLPSWPNVYSTPWLRIEADVSREGDEDEYEALVLDHRFADGARLLIGRDIEDLDEREEGIADTATWLLPALILLVIGGAVLMSLTIGRWIDDVSVAARRVMDGDMSQRIPLRGTGDDFDGLAETLNLMLARIEASLEAVRRVSDTVAHELRTPLVRLQASLRELQAAPDDDGRQIAEAIEEADRLGLIFDAVLRISRIEANRHDQDLALVDLSTLLHDAVELYRPAAEDRRQTLDADIAPGLLVRGDSGLLFQAVSNLLDNAVKFTPRGGRIALAAVRQGETSVVSVADDGPGIAAGVEDKLSERFYRAGVAADVPGFGLGLSLVAAIAAFHNSTIRFMSTNPGFRAEWTLSAAKA